MPRYFVRRPPYVPWLTWLIVGSTVAVFACQVMVTWIYGDDLIGNALSFNNQALPEGRYWTLLTYAWVHAVPLGGRMPAFFWLHIVLNLVPLLWLGPLLEEYLGRWLYFELYAGGAILAALTWNFFNPSLSEGIIGASGAVFAVITAAATAPRGFLNLHLRIDLRLLAAVSCGAEAVQILLNWMPEAAHSAHLGGAAFGFLYGMAVRLGRR